MRRVLAVEAHDEVAPRLEVRVGLGGGPDRRQVVEGDRVPLGDAPELVPVVVLVDDEDLPAVLVDVEGAPLVDVALALLERGVDDPDPVQLVAQVVGVHVERREDVLELDARVLELVGVVGDVDLLLADELPVVLVRRAVEHVELVARPHVVGGGAGVVVGDLRGAADAPLARVVEPGVAGLRDLVHRLVDEEDAAREARRGDDALLEVEEPVRHLRLGHVREVVDEHRLLLELRRGCTGRRASGPPARPSGSPSRRGT